jgi:nitric oxide reductase NorE protein
MIPRIGEGMGRVKMTQQNAVVCRANPGSATGLPAKDVAGNARHLPGEAGVWVFVFGDMTVFALMFGSYVYYRALEVDVFVASMATVNQTLGLVNTLLLLTSSLFTALGVKAIDKHNGALAQILFLLAIGCGLGFVIIKLVEYQEKFLEGYTIATNNYYMFYYVLTLTHLVHLVLGGGGLIFLAMMAGRLRSEEKTVSQTKLFEGVGVYWHLVDLVWVVLFPLLYTVR